MKDAFNAFDREMLTAALALRDQPLQFAGTATPPFARPLRVTKVYADGMVEVDQLPGRFAPHLFVVVPEVLKS